ncbi:hypothetical protein C0J52_19676 [Blattella germanica]|nr:hypothetical protein C0J52_19676 [Blattella germanica]
MLSILLGNFVLKSLIVLCLFLLCWVGSTLFPLPAAYPRRQCVPRSGTGRTYLRASSYCLEHNVNYLESTLVAVYK